LQAFVANKPQLSRNCYLWIS